MTTPETAFVAEDVALLTVLDNPLVELPVTLLAHPLQAFGLFTMRLADPMKQPASLIGLRPPWRAAATQLTAVGPSEIAHFTGLHPRGYNCKVGAEYTSAAKMAKIETTEKANCIFMNSERVIWIKKAKNGKRERQALELKDRTEIRKKEASSSKECHAEAP